MKEIVCIIGTRPQLIKHAVLLKELKKAFCVQTINTLQHYQYELNNQLVEELYDDEEFDAIQLRHTLSPAERLGEMIYGLAKITHKNANAVLVYGDTDSTLAGALTANKLNKKLVHVEAGERSYNKEMPEERNRVIVDQLSHLHFCSSENAANNLRAEKITENVYYVGDLMKDLLLKNISPASLCSEPYIFCTIHRNYNKNDPEKLKAFLHKLTQLPKKIYFSVHPATLALISDYGIDLKVYHNIIFLPPLSYNRSIAYQKGADAIITDSGGIQKEAYWLKKVCITIRKETEWIETLKGKWNQLLYGDLNSLPHLLNTIPAEEEYNAELYGNGKACGNIRKILSKLI